MNEPAEQKSPRQTWEQGWDGHELAQRRRLANLPLAEKLVWLEEAQKVVVHLQKRTRRAEDATSADE